MGTANWGGGIKIAPNAWVRAADVVAVRIVTLPAEQQPSPRLPGPRLEGPAPRTDQDRPRLALEVTLRNGLQLHFPEDERWSATLAYVAALQALADEPAVQEPRTAP